MTKSAVSCGLVKFTKEILNGKLLFLGNDSDGSLLNVKIKYARYNCLPETVEHDLQSVIFS